MQVRMVEPLQSRLIQARKGDWSLDISAGLLSSGCSVALRGRIAEVCLFVCFNWEDFKNYVFNYVFH